MGCHAVIGPPGIKNTEWYDIPRLRDDTRPSEGETLISQRLLHFSRLGIAQRKQRSPNLASPCC
jgi:hypothetical protein